MLRAEVLRDRGFRLLTIDDRSVLDGMDYIERHNINSADAAILAAFLQYAQSQSQGVTCVLVAADQRFLRAAQAEGMAVLNPEIISAVDVPTYIASL